MKANLAGAAALIVAAVCSPDAIAQKVEELGDSTGVRYADPNETVDGPKSIGDPNGESPVPYFRDLKPWDVNYAPPRTADGKPDLQGVWSTASLTTLTRGENGGGGPRAPIETLVIPPEKIAELMALEGYVQYAESSQKRTDPTSGAFTDKNPDAGYNYFWIDPGSEYGRVNGEWRSSWIVSPANGRIPYTPAALASMGGRMKAARDIDNTGPEIRTLGDRCLISFANQGGPPITNTMYNNNVQIVQTEDHVVLQIEMNHDARIVRLQNAEKQAKRLPGNIEQWFGDSIGWWDGDTLVVETRNLNPHQARGRIPLSKEGKVIERFRRVSDLEIDYTYEVVDPVNYTETWKGQMPLRKSAAPVYEYACHEGNYALPGILIGMREGLETALEAEGE